MIEDKVIDGYLSTLFGNSEPGAALHQLVFANADPADLTALGVPKIKLTLYALAPTSEVDSNQFVAQAIRAATAEARHKGTPPYFVGLAIEVHGVPDDGNEVTENLARRLGADRLLHEHPKAVELTALYAACRDGRRWLGEHILTGDRAGHITGPQLRVGPVLEGRERGLHQRLVRAAVGLA